MKNYIPRPRIRAPGTFIQQEQAYAPPPLPPTPYPRAPLAPPPPPLPLTPMVDRYGIFLKDMRATLQQIRDEHMYKVHREHLQRLHQEKLYQAHTEYMYNLQCARRMFPNAGA